MKKIICPICGKRTKNLYYCEHCGMDIPKDFHIIDCFEIVDKYLENNNLDIKYYLKSKGNKVNQSKIREIINSMQAFKNIVPIELIDALIRIESLEYKKNNKNITQNMACLFWWLHWNLPNMDGYYKYWFKRAIKEKYKEQIEWAISDFKHGDGVKQNIRKANKLKELLNDSEVK